MAETLIWPLGLPDAETTRQNILACRDYDPLAVDFKQLKRCFDLAAPVQLHYVPTVMPSYGIAPEHIRRQWLDLSLPVRSKEVTKEFGEGFVVQSREALEILRTERPEAHEWWRNYYIDSRKQANGTALRRYEKSHDEPWPYTALPPIPENKDFPEYGANMDWFVFSPDEGLVTPVPAYRESLRLNEPLFKMVMAQGSES
jgi:hypothetical protein